MKADLPRAFADITARLEDAHALAVEGQRRDNSPDMQRALACHLRMAVVAMGGIVSEIKQTLGDARD